MFLAAGHSKLGTLITSRRIRCKNSHILFLLIHQGAIFLTLQFDSSVSMIKAFPKKLFQMSERGSIPLSRTLHFHLEGIFLHIVA